MANIGQRIKQRRQEIGLTQESLALKMGYKSKSTINKIELGINDIPQSKIAKFAEVLGVDIAYLMDWEAEKEKNSRTVTAVMRIRKDGQFAKIVDDICKLDDEQLALIEQLIKALPK